MKNFDTRTYSISDFIEWHFNSQLEISPDFQRRSVWNLKAKSYLVDTILSGKPIPKIIITQKLIGKKTVRVVVDGQQRLRTIIGYYNDEFKVSKIHNEEFAKYTFSTLPDNLKYDFLKFELGVDLLFDMPFEEILDVFTRINSYTVKLNNPEQYNAQYLGYFKQLVHKTGLKYVQYFLDSRILTKAKVSRMGETELTADLMIAILDNVQSNKKIESYYIKYEDTAGNLKKAVEKFDTTMTYIFTIYPAKELTETNWSRIHLF